MGLVMHILNFLIWFVGVMGGVVYHNRHLNCEIIRKNRYKRPG